ncbi:MAG TPA: ABC transporter permease [Ilumatobacteraceae bacterium]|nr:ABC transporter permease [Ilumatobacteraceae bacterium]
MSTRLFVRKMIDALVLLAMVLVFNFFLFRVVDRDPLARYRGRSKLSQEQRAAIIHRFGLDGSKWDQFVQYISHTLRGDFGRSFDTTKPVGQEILAALPNTLLLVGISTVLTIGIGLWIGIRAGWRRGSTFDKVSTPATMALYGTPEFFLGMLFLAFFGARLGWFPTGGSVDPAGSYTGFAAIVDRARHLVLPVATLTLGYLGSYSLVMRTSMLDTLREDYLTTARAKGLRDNDVMRRHAVPNALLPSVSLIAIGFGFIIGGAITTETVFSYPGLGLETYQAIGNNDLPMMQALFMFSSIAVIVFNIGADMVLTILDPRIRVGG